MAKKTEYGDEAKLPKWAQSELLSLRYKIADLEREIAIARGKAPENGATGKVIADDLQSRGFPLHDRALISFDLGGKHRKIQCMLRDVGGRTMLDINASWGTLHIKPQASNVIYATVDD